MLGIARLDTQAQSNGVYREVYLGIPGNAVADLTNAPAFPNTPSVTGVLSSFEAPTDFDDNYGQRLRALLLPPASGNYTLWIASDNTSILYLSSDASPANKVAIASVNSWTSSREWTKETNQVSVPIRLSGGQRYYIEVLHKEGNVSDNLAVRWQIPGGVIEEPIPAARLLPYGRPATIPPTITAQPTNTTVVEGSPAVFRVNVSNTDALAYQWQRNSNDVAGAVGATHTIPAAALGDSAASFRCVLSNALGVVTSAVAVLTVTVDTIPPAISGARSDGIDRVVVTFSEPVEPASALNVTNYLVNNGIAVNSAAFGTDTRTIILSVSPLSFGTNYTLTVNNVRDRASTANTIAANARRTFQAIGLTCGVAQIASLSVPGEQDVYPFVGLAGDLITLRLISTTANFTPQIDLYDPDGQYGTASTGNITLTLLKTGTYQAMIRFNSGSSLTGAYQLGYQRLNSPCNATAISCGTLLTNTLASFQEMDAYSLALSAGDVITLRLNSASSDFAPAMEFYDPYGQNVSNDYNEITRPIGITGNYTLIVRYAGGNTFPGAYRLAVQRTKNPCNTIALACGTLLTNAINRAGELKAYSLTTAAPGEAVTWRVESATTDFVPYLELYDPSGNRIDGQYNAITRTLTAVGAHTLLVRYGGGNNLTGTYRLAVLKTKDPCNSILLACGTNVQGSIARPGEYDAFSLDANAADTLQLAVNGMTADFTPSLEFFDPDGSGVRINNGLTDVLTKSGRYTVLVSRHPNSSLATGNYQFQWQRVNNPCNATLMACGVVQNGAISVAGENDAYVFTAAAGEAVSVWVGTTNSDFAPLIQVYDPDGKPLNAPYPYSGFNGTLTKSGNYTVLVSRWTGDSYTGSYQLQWQRIDNPCKATPLACGTVQYGVVSVPGEANAYTLTAAVGEVIMVWTGTTNTDFAPFLQIFDPNGRALSVPYPYSRFSGPITEAGTYTVLVNRWTGNSFTGSYQVQWQRLLNPCNGAPLACGVIQNGTISVPDEADAYTFNVAAGEVIAVWTGTTNTDFAPFLQVFDPNGQALTVPYPNSRFSGPVTETGTYTVLVNRWTGNSFTGNYQLQWQRLHNPCRASSLACGVTVTNAIVLLGQSDAYTVDAAAGDRLGFRFAGRTPSFIPQIDLFDPDGVAVTVTSGDTGWLQKTGRYTVMVSKNNNSPSPTGTYQIIWQNLESPCNVVPVTSGAVTAGSIDSSTEVDAYTFAANAGELTVCLLSQTNSFNPLMELYNANGIFLASGNGSIQVHLITSGIFNLLVRDTGAGTGGYKISVVNSNISCGTIDLQDPSVTVLSPNGGEFIAIGSPLQITWSSSDNFGVFSHEIRLSTDGGATFPTVLATGLASNANSFSWSIPANLLTRASRIRVIARDATGNTSYDDSDDLFVLYQPAELQSTAYAYDALSQLIRASYSDGSVISYAYDPAGNRTNLTVLAGTNADSDSDGMPDSWEITNGLNPFDPSDAGADPDGDGMTNLQEYLAGTNPLSAASGLFILSGEVVGTNVRINFSSVAGKHYLVEWSNALGSGYWTPLPGSLTGTGGTMQVTDVGGAGSAQHFYRVLLLP